MPLHATTPVTARGPKVRAPVAAGRFHPADASALREVVEELLASAPPQPPDAPVPKALIVPHGRYVVAGPVAARAYARVLGGRERVRRAVVLGPSHHVHLAGLATSTYDAFETPLGLATVDREAVARVERLPQVHRLDAAHRREHSLEVQLPFLQVVVGSDLRVVPLSVGDAAPAEIAAVLEALWDGPETLVVVSSDLSRGLDEETARALDDTTRSAIEALRPDLIGEEQASGHLVIRGLLSDAARRKMRVETLDVRTSAEATGVRDGVVGHGAWALFERPSLRGGA